MGQDAAQLLGAYPSAWLVVTFAFLASFFLTWGAYGLALKKRLLPDIRTRDSHAVRKPRVGGVAMWISVLLTILLIGVLDRSGELLRFRSGVTLPDTLLWGVIGGMFVLLVTGILDDIFSLTPWQQFVGQVLAGVSLVLSGAAVTFIRLPLDKTLVLDQWKVSSIHLLDGSVLLPWSALLIIGWVVLIVNVLNFFDGLDGLAASITLTTSVILLFVSLRFGLLGPISLSLIIMGVALGFLPWNWHPSRLFMGTVGSQLLGFLLAVTAIVSGAKVATATLVLGLPLFDAMLVVMSRLRAHQSPFQADRRHLHHRLLGLGLSTPQVALIVNGIALVFGVLALRTQESTVKGILTLVLLATMLAMVMLVWWLENRLATATDSK